jgi:hypothetical protein
MKVLLMMIAGVMLFEGPVSGWELSDTRFALHRKNPTTTAGTICTTYSPIDEGIPCVGFNTVGPAPGSSLVYFVIGFAPDVGIDAVSFGIDYNGRTGTASGIDPAQNDFTLCSDGFGFYAGWDFNSDGTVTTDEEFPAPMGGAVITWQTCQNQAIGVYGVHTAIGALELYAYSEDVLELTTNTLNEPIPILGVHTCDGVSSNVAPSWYYTAATVHLGGDGSPGTNPCAGVTAVDASPSTWGKIKALYGSRDGGARR